MIGAWLARLGVASGSVVMASILRATVIYAIGIFWTCTLLPFILLRVLWSPLKAFRKTPRDIPPAILHDGSYTHQFVSANGLKFHCVSRGDKGNPLMLFIHGFPEFWFSWRHQLTEFSKKYHVVAVDMRGYGDSDKPTKKIDYRMENLVQDIVELVPALGHKTCTLVAHDWGGAIAWYVAALHPTLLDKLVIMNAPHPKVFQKELKTFKQFMMSWYFFVFQLPWFPEFLLSSFDFSVFEDMTKHFVNKESVSPEEIEAYKFVFSKPGALTGPINYYRCALMHTDRKFFPRKGKIEVTSMIIWGDRDTVLNMKLADNTVPYVTDLTIKHIANSSHFVHQDTPAEVHRLMWEFLQQ